jgi:glucan 1,3-beta-glucosidase
VALRHTELRAISSRWEDPVIKGVNLGNWLVLEKWMSPGLFAGTEAEDETQLSCDLADAAKRERLTAHRDSYITERDFAYLARHGIDTVRIPVPFFIFGDYPPYVGCVEYLDRAFGWAETHEIKILIDLHTVPDSQNGFDNGGMCGVCKWHKNPAHVEFALTVLEQLTSRYRARTALWGIEVLNEPISEQLWDAIDLPHRYPPRDPDYARGSEPVPTGFLKDFYTVAYRRIRAQSDAVTIVFHDGFRIREWEGFFTSPEFERIVVDTHLYLMEYTLRTGDGDLHEYLRHIRNEFGPTVREMSPEFPLMVGEWCLEPMSAKAAAMPQEERLDFYRSLADAQLAAWDGTVGWFFWSYKLLVDGSNLDGWDLRKSIELGYLPESFGR